MVNSIIAELLLIGLVVLVFTTIASTILTPSIARPEYYIKVSDAYPPASSGELFDVLMLSGSIKYSQFKLVLINATDGTVIDTAKYDNGFIKGRVISAKIQDVDDTFATGDYLRFNGTLPAGIYELVIVSKNYVVFDSYINIK